MLLFRFEIFSVFGDREDEMIEMIRFFASKTESVINGVLVDLSSVVQLSYRLDDWGIKESDRDTMIDEFLTNEKAMADVKRKVDEAFGRKEA